MRGILILDWNKIRVYQDGATNFEMYIDGVKITGIREFEYNNSVDNVPTISMVMSVLGDVKFEIDKGDDE